MSPNETLFLESTNKIYKDDISSTSFVNFQIWDFPGQVDFFDSTFDSEMIFKGTGALIFVIDAQVWRRGEGEARVWDEWVEKKKRVRVAPVVGRLRGGSGPAAPHGVPSVQGEPGHQL